MTTIIWPCKKNGQSKDTEKGIIIKIGRKQRKKMINQK
jgi:hypothetical protein